MGRRVVDGHATRRHHRPGRGWPAHVAYLLPVYLFDLEGGWTDVGAVVAVPGRYLTRP